MKQFLVLGALMCMAIPALALAQSDNTADWYASFPDTTTNTGNNPGNQNAPGYYNLGTPGSSSGGRVEEDKDVRQQSYLAGGLVTCEGPDCNWCSFVQLVNNIVKWLIAFLSVFAVIIMVIAGFKMVTSGGNLEAWESGKRMLTSVVIGIIIVLSAWLLIDVLLRTLTTRGGINDWIPSDCGGARQAQTNTGSSSGSSSTSGGGTGCPTCAQIQGIPCKDANSCTVASEYANRLPGLNSSGILITEAYPPTRTHQAACHSNGTCTDVVFADRNFTPERVRTFQQQAAANGFRAVYEPPAGVSCSGYSNCLPYSTTRSTGHHFSLYLE